MDCTKTKAALYIRVSTEEQAMDGQSVDAQIETLTQYCKLYNIEIYHIYKDLGVSGKSAKNRPGLQLMLKDASANKFNIVLVWKISRLSRSLKDLLLILDQLDKDKIVFTSYSEKFDTSNAVGRMTMQLLGSIAEFERNTIIDNVKLGLREYARKGGKTGTILGYDNINKQLKINQLEAKIIRLIFKLYVKDRMSMGDIAGFLNNQGYKTKRGKDFRKDSISIILNNPAYKGINRHNVGTEKESQTQGAHQPIINTEIWEAAQSLRQSNKLKRPIRNEETSFILSGKLICTDCSNSMLGFSTKTASKAYRYYRCKGCGRLISASKIDKIILDILYRLLQNNQIAKDTLYKINSPEAITNTDIELQQIQSLINNYNSQLDKYVALLEIDHFNKSNIILDKIKNIEEKQRQLQASWESLSHQSIEKQNEFIEADYYRIIEAVFQDKSKESMVKILNCAIKYITIDKKNHFIRVAFAFNLAGGSVLDFVL